MSKPKRFKDPPLQPLRIPIGWHVAWNTFYELDPKFKTYDDFSWNFKTDMLLLNNEQQRLAIDLSWHPTACSAGHFYVTLVELIGDNDADWRHPIEVIETRSRRKVVQTIEQWLKGEWSPRVKRRLRKRGI